MSSFQSSELIFFVLIYQKTALGCFVARQEKDEELEVLKYSLHASAVTGLKGLTVGLSLELAPT